IVSARNAANDADLTIDTTADDEMRFRAVALSLGANGTYVLQPTSDAATRLSAAPHDLTLAGDTFTLSADLTFGTSAQSVVRFSRGASIDHGSHALTINGAIDAHPDQQIFTGSGAVSLPDVEIVHPGWFGAVGDGSTDDAVPLQKAIDALGT